MNTTFKFLLLSSLIFAIPTKITASNPFSDLITNDTYKNAEFLDPVRDDYFSCMTATFKTLKTLKKHKNFSIKTVKRPYTVYELVRDRILEHEATFDDSYSRPNKPPYNLFSFARGLYHEVDNKESLNKNLQEHLQKTSSVYASMEAKQFNECFKPQLIISLNLFHNPLALVAHLLENQKS